MFKRFVLSLALVLAFALPASAEVSGVYGGLKIIDSIQTMWGSGDLGGSQSQNTIGGGIFLGYDFYPQSQIPLRVELEYALRSNVTSSETAAYGANYVKAEGTWGLQTLFANAYLDFHNSTAFTPYVGAGLGMGFISNSYDISGNLGNGYFSDSKNKTNTVFAWNAGVGCAYAFNDNIAADLAYRYVGLGENEVKWQGAKLNTQGGAHEFSLGLRFTY